MDAVRRNAAKLFQQVGDGPFAGLRCDDSGHIGCSEWEIREITQAFVRKVQPFNYILKSDIFPLKDEEPVQGLTAIEN